MNVPSASGKRGLLGRSAPGSAAFTEGQRRKVLVARHPLMGAQHKGATGFRTVACDWHRPESGHQTGVVARNQVLRKRFKSSIP